MLAFRIFLAHDAYFQREFRQICISFGWQANGTAAATAGTSGDHGEGEAEPTFMGVSMEDFSGVPPPLPPPLAPYPALPPILTLLLPLPR